MSFTHKFSPSSLREYDIRGIVGEALSEADAFAIGRVFGSMVAETGGKKVVVGRDGRLSSPMLSASLIRGLISSGMDVTDVGQGPTPMLYFASFDKAASDFAQLAKTRLAMPVLSIGGEKSLGAVLGQQMKLVALNVTVVVLPRTGHWLMEERPKETMEAMLKFL